MLQFNERASAHHGYVRTLRASAREYLDPHVLYSESRETIRDILNTSNVLKLRLIICLSIIFEKNSFENVPMTKSFYFCSYCERILSSQQILPRNDSAFTKILQSIDSFVRNGSGWTIKLIDYIDLHIGNYRDIRGGCQTSQQLPDKLRNKKALLNINCHDNFCFLYCIAAKLYPQKINKSRPNKYKKYFKYFNIRNIGFPMKLKQISNFELANNLKINVFGFEENEIYPLYVSSKLKKHTEIDLLYYNKHYFLITNFNRLLNFRNGIHHFCRNCLNGFQRREALISHRRICLAQSPQKLSIPKILSLKFDAYSKMLYHPFTAYADFECITPKVSSVAPSNAQSYTCEIERRMAVSYTLIVLDINDSIIFHEYYVGSDAVTKFLTTVKEVSINLIRKMQKVMAMDSRLNNTINQNVCHICRKKFEPWDIRVRDHCHTNGYIRGL